MAEWLKNPIIYEINTWVWLGELSRRYGQQVTLASVPDEEWEALGKLGVDAVWLMGVWERSPLGRQIAADTPAMVEEFRSVLPDYSDSDNVGSPYCVRRYVVDSQLGGPDGLARARKNLASHGIKLILDYVPNHVALDHPWVAEHGGYFIQGSESDLEQNPAAWFKVGDKTIARGRDPNFPPWPDVAQLNAYSPELRKAVIELVTSIADQCDGMRCDMAMLMMTDIFRRTWGERAGAPAAREFWPEVIGAVKQRHPGVLFIAEAYWDLEYTLQQQGFDFCYDKRLYDRLVHENADSVRGHLSADIDFQNRLLRFIENHDEPRAANALAPTQKERAAALFAVTLPGARLLHQGQFTGKRTRVPVFLRRAPEEPEDRELASFYRELLKSVRDCGGLRGDWSLCEVSGWPDNQSCRNLLAWAWRDDSGPRALVVVNYSGSASQGIVHLPWSDFGQGIWMLADLLKGQTYERTGRGMSESGLYVELEPWGKHYLQTSLSRALAAAA